MKGEFISIETAQIMADIEKENENIWDVYLKCAKERYELLSRIEKAIEYIKQCGELELVKNYSIDKPIMQKEVKKDLLKILRGDENE